LNPLEHRPEPLRAFFFGLTPKFKNIPFVPTETLFAHAGQNTGNLAISHALDRTIANVVGTVGWHTESEMLHDSRTAAIMALSNQLGPHADMGDPSGGFARLACRMVGIGLGAQAPRLDHEIQVPAGTLDWVRVMQDHAPTSSPNIALRGEFTRRLLEKHGLADKTTVLGCPTLFLSPEKNLGAKVAERFAQTCVGRVAVAAGHQHWRHLRPLEHSLVGIIDKTNGAYVCQSPLEMVRLGRAEAAILEKTEFNDCLKYVHPQKSPSDFTEWTKEKAFSFFSVPAWMEFLRRFDFVVGTRIHGAILGLQAGIPSLCITHDSRTAELCQTMKIPGVPASAVAGGVTVDRLASLFEFDPAVFDRNRQHLAAAYAAFLESNGLFPSPQLEGLAGRRPSEPPAL
jgi:hypothetical protein